MKVAEIKTTLKESGISFPSKAKKSELMALLPAEKPKPENATNIANKSGAVIQKELEDAYLSGDVQAMKRAARQARKDGTTYAVQETSIAAITADGRTELQKFHTVKKRDDLPASSLEEAFKYSSPKLRGKIWKGVIAGQKVQLSWARKDRPARNPQAMLKVGDRREPVNSWKEIQAMLKV